MHTVNLKKGANAINVNVSDVIIYYAHLINHKINVYIWDSLIARVCVFQKNINPYILPSSKIYFSSYAWYQHFSCTPDCMYLNIRLSYIICSCMPFFFRTNNN